MTDKDPLTVKKIQYNIMFYIVIVVLATLIVVRWILPEESHAWIDFINYAGLVIAVLSLFFDLYHAYQDCRKIYRVIGFFTIFLAALSIVGVLIFTDILVLDAKGNDIIMLVTLLVSLPAQLYVRLMGKHLKN